ncbi:ParB/RepB/Spo0J family partition protein [Rhizobium sp. AG207R]|uniref:ParB/RepB/Spo0J family partition protein n=1 Tax=Rhizobium sp. AG207R TaxID=2802287 RepID=UPI0022ABE621|nr:ParB/RepB/Spo0J family partition protein [Rhizobium sp. AG207R]MCZ3377457.1 ParB N-terminal domain-containing protein [Rhizobium sp. AG207R]
MNDTLFPILKLGGEIEGGRIGGHIGRFEIISIEKLFVDSVYQRAISQGSVKNIKRICENFDWAKFLPVIVTQDGDTYSIVDGQHRTTAAATIGIEAVPCYVLSCTASEAAAAFAAINGNVTPVQPIDLWFAELAAKKPSAVALQRVLDAANVKVTRKKEGFLSGETRSITVLQRALDFYGSAILTTILQCIVETSDGNPGMLFGAMINGIGRAIRTKPEALSNPARLFDIFDDINLSEMLYAARIESAHSGNPVQFIITRQINALIKSGAAREVADAA